jgi:hypothetical protein
MVAEDGDSRKRTAGDRKSDSESESSESEADDSPTSRQFLPTVPRSLSGSPKKPANAQLDPERPQTGMCFGALEESVHFVSVYENRRGYKWMRKSNIRNADGECTSKLLGDLSTH